ncbi:hypothetical protein OF83DRAFT_1179296 [Amylostereum chailletii]|nr:hypothetical protein OF83DRAFT_1179296 [Amylostereum chailletii]
MAKHTRDNAPEDSDASAEGTGPPDSSQRKKKQSATKSKRSAASSKPTGNKKKSSNASSKTSKTSKQTARSASGTTAAKKNQHGSHEAVTSPSTTPRSSQPEDGDSTPDSPTKTPQEMEREILRLKNISAEACREALAQAGKKGDEHAAFVYAAVQRYCHDVTVQAKYDFGCSYGKSSPIVRSRIYKALADQEPILESFKNHWVSEIIVSQFVGNRRRTLAKEARKAARAGGSRARGCSNRTVDELDSDDDPDERGSSGSNEYEGAEPKDQPEDGEDDEEEGVVYVHLVSLLSGTFPSAHHMPGIGAHGRVIPAQHTQPAVPPPIDGPWRIEQGWRDTGGCRIVKSVVDSISNVIDLIPSVVDLRLILSSIFDRIYNVLDLISNPVFDLISSVADLV